MTPSDSKPALRPLLLAGGKSTRMGTPKHLLQLPDGRPLYQHLVNVLLKACPEAQRVCVSLARDSPMDPPLRAVADGRFTKGRVEIIHDFDASQNESESESDAETAAGPTAGLLAAHRKYPDASWMVLACDYPFATPEALQHLRSVYAPPVTCYHDEDGLCEPLMGIWSPEALERLAARPGEDPVGSSCAVQDQRGLMVRPPLDQALLLHKANTKDNWNLALRQLMNNPLVSSTEED